MNIRDTGYVNVPPVYKCSRARRRRSPPRRGTSADGAATLTSIAAACSRTPRAPSPVRRTCKRSRVIPVLSEESRNTAHFRKVAAAAPPPDYTRKLLSFSAGELQQK